MSKKIGNNQMKQNLKTGKVGKLKLLFEGASPLLREKQVRPNFSKYNPFAVHDKLNPRVRPGYDRRDMMGNRTPVWQELESRDQSGRPLAAGKFEGGHYFRYFGPS